MTMRSPHLPSGRLRRPPARRPIGRAGAAAVVLVLVAATVPAGRWLWTRQSLAWQVNRGLELLAGADNPPRVRAALNQWELETRPNWESRREELINHLFGSGPLDDQRVRWLLTRVAGADFGPQREDWQRWFDTRRRIRQGLAPDVSRRDAVRLERQWVAAIGLTAWFTTILPLDGQIFVASLGADFNDPPDRADGVVRVDGVTGAADLFFIPPETHRGPRDVIGLAVADRGLIAACYNGSVYSLDARGQLRWHAHIGDPVVAPPLAVDLNRDGTTDALLVTRGGRVVALNGRNGRTIWVTSVGRPGRGGDLLGATLALGDVLARGENEVLVTLPTGRIEVLGLRDGRSRWHHELAAGTVSGAIGLRRPTKTDGLAAYLGDRSATVWSLIGSAGRAETLRGPVLSIRHDETLVASLRTIGVGAGHASGAGTRPLLLACPTGGYADGFAALCALSPEGVHWRLPIDGAIWGSPAVADLNGNGVPEIVAAGIISSPDGRSAGVIKVVSAAGHILHRVVLDAPVECAPVIADVDGDRRLEVLVADQSGRLHCFGTTGFGPVEWGTFGGDSHNTRNAVNAYSFGQMPLGYQWGWTPE